MITRQRPTNNNNKPLSQRGTHSNSSRSTSHVFESVVGRIKGPKKKDVRVPCAKKVKSDLTQEQRCSSEFVEPPPGSRRLLGQGEFGKVFLTCCDDQCDYVVKEIKLPIDRINEFQREYEASVVASERNIGPTIYDAHYCPNQRKAFIYFEKMDGDFADWVMYYSWKRLRISEDGKETVLIDTKEPFPGRDEIYRQWKQRLNEFHEAGWVHGDVSTGNVLYKQIVPEKGSPAYQEWKLTDFGKSERIGPTSEQQLSKKSMRMDIARDQRIQNDFRDLDYAFQRRAYVGVSVDKFAILPPQDWIASCVSFSSALDIQKSKEIVSTRADDPTFACTASAVSFLKQATTKDWGPSGSNFTIDLHRGQPVIWVKTAGDVDPSRIIAYISGFRVLEGDKAVPLTAGFQDPEITQKEILFDVEMAPWLSKESVIAGTNEDERERIMMGLEQFLRQKFRVNALPITFYKRLKEVNLPAV